MAKPEEEQRTEGRIQTRQVTHYQVSWSERERGERGALTVQLILDHGVDEYVLRPTAEDAEVLLELFERGGTPTFDVERKVLVFPVSSVEEGGPPL